MGILSRLTSLFSRSGRDENTLLEGIEHAKAKRPQKAIELYDALLDCKTTSAEIRAKALFNRALAHSSQSNDSRALADLEALLAMPGLAENVQGAARAQLLRVRKRLEE